MRPYVGIKLKIDNSENSLLEVPGFEPGASHMRSERSTTELHPHDIRLSDAMSDAGESPQRIKMDLAPSKRSSGDIFNVNIDATRNISYVRCMMS